MSFKISIDVDGVILQTLERFLEIYNNKYPTNKKEMNDMICWNFFKSWGLNESEAWEIFDEIKTLEIPIVDKKIPKYMKFINGFNHVDILTARRKETREDLLKKFDEIGLKQGVHYNELIFVPNVPSYEKLHWNYDIYVDDSPNLAENKLLHPYGKTLILFIQPWNKHILEFPRIGVIGAKSWKHVYSIFKRIKHYRENENE